VRHEDARSSDSPFFCPITLRYEVLCPLGPGWGCPHGDAQKPAREGSARELAALRLNGVHAHPAARHASA
jgi:hypothetical protein